jgi:ketosteroid isomerase-like protein
LTAAGVSRHDSQVAAPFDAPQAELAWMFLQNLCSGGDLDEAFELVTDDFTYWSIITRTAVDKATLRRKIEHYQHTTEITLELIRYVNQGDTVVVETEADGVTIAGVRYDSPIVFIFETRDGLISELREYSDTRLAQQAFG